MEFRQLRHFLAVAEAGGFTAAATRIHLSQPALSQSILRLERDLGCALFVRSKQNPGTGLTLTPAGASLRADAREILDAIDRARGRARRASPAGAPVPVTIGFTSATPRHLTDAALRVPGLRVPGLLTAVEVLPVHLIWGEEHPALRSGRVDLAFLQYPPGAAVSACTVVTLARSPRAALLPAGHPLARRGSASLDDLADEPVLDPGFGDEPAMHRDYWLGEPRPHGPRGPVIVGPAVRTVEEMCVFVAAGKGLAIASATLAQNYGRADLAFVPVDGLAPVDFGLVRLTADTRPHIQAVFDAITALAVSSG